ncbi:hypothetical protein ACHAWF_001802, partial [Thalassiosira exigua]
MSTSHAGGGRAVPAAASSSGSDEADGAYGSVAPKRPKRVEAGRGRVDRGERGRSDASASASDRPRAPSDALRRRSVLCMSLSLAIHLGGYELARSAVMALFTSDSLGFGNGGEGGLSALPMAVGCVSPFSVGLLWFYARTLERGGPSSALRTHSLICAGAQIVSGWMLKAFDGRLHGSISPAWRLSDVAAWSKPLLFFLFVFQNAYVFSIHPDTICAPAQIMSGWMLKAFDSRLHGSMSPAWRLADATAWSKPLLFFLFVFQNAYVQLLYNQHWAFITSALTPEEGAKAFAPIAGLGSIASTLAAGLVSHLVNGMGLTGLLHAAGVSYVVSAILADFAFGISRIGGFEPSKYDRTSSVGPGEDHATTSQSTTADGGKGAYAPVSTSESAEAPPPPRPPPSQTLPCLKKSNIFRQAYALFRRVPVLEALFFEVVISQCLSSLVNFVYLYKLKSTVADDAERAGWSGSFYAWINGVSGIFQFFVIPL